MTPPAIRSLLTLALGLALAPPAGSLPSRPLGPVVRSFQTYGLEQGLACLSTMAILQSRDGLLWVATQEGVFRYDGDRFEDLGRAQGLPSGLVFDLAEDADGTIWAGTLKGLARRTGESWRTVELPGSPAGEAIEAVGVDAEGKLLAAAIGGVWRCPGATCERIFTVPADAFANSLALDRRSGDLWFGGSFGVVRFHDHELERYAGPAAGIDAAIRSLLVTRDGTVFLRTADGLARLDPRRRRFAPVPGIPSAADSSKLFEDRAGVLWVPSDAGLTALAGDRAERRERFGVEQGLPSSATATVFEDREGSLWVSLAYAGVARWLGRDRFTAWTPTTGLPDETVWSIARLADGTLAFGTQRGLALVSPAGDAIRTVGAAEGLPGEFVLALAAAPDGGLWVGTAEGGFAHVRADGRVTDLGPGAGLGRDTAIAALAPAPDGTLWVGTSEGLWLGRGDPRRLRLRRVPLPAGDGSPAERPPAEIVSDVLADRAGRVVVAGRYGLALRDGGSWRRLTRADGLLDDHLLSLAETPAGELWIAYRDGRGVSQLSWPEGRARLRHFGPREGLRHDQATFVRADAAGRVWVGTTRGLSVRVGERFASFGRPDGMISEDTCTNAFLAERDGRVWIGTPRGAIAARLGERDLAPPPAPGVRLFSAALGGEPLDLGRAAIAPYSRRLFEARFAPLTFRHEGEVEMRSELVGLPGSAVIGRERRARFPMLAPGRYAFVASARIPGGAWSAPASYPFEIRPPWWGTTAARAVGLLSLVFAGAVVDRWRSRRARRERERLEAAVELRTHELAASREELARMNGELAALATTDPLTGLKNRRFAADFLAAEVARVGREWARARSGGRPCEARLTFFLLDLDRFKSINDLHGHECGDRVLVETAARLCATVRGSDFVVRWGGEEFLIVARDLPEVEWPRFAGRLRDAIAALPFDLGPGWGAVRCTASLGYAAYPFAPGAELAWEQTLRLADLALYAVKQAGRDAHLGVLAAGAEGSRPWVATDLAAAARTGQVRLEWSGPERAAV